MSNMYSRIRCFRKTHKQHIRSNPLTVRKAMFAANAACRKSSMNFINDVLPELYKLAYPTTTTNVTVGVANELNTEWECGKAVSLADIRSINPLICFFFLLTF